MNPTLATVVRDALTLEDEDQGKVLDILRMVRGELTLEDTEEVAELATPLPRPAREKLPTRPMPSPKGRRAEAYNVSAEMLNRFLALLTIEAQPRQVLANRSNMPRATFFRCEHQGIFRGLVVRSRSKGRVHLRLAPIQTSQRQATEETSE